MLFRSVVATYRMGATLVVYSVVVVVGWGSGGNTGRGMLGIVGIVGISSSLDPGMRGIAGMGCMGCTGWNGEGDSCSSLFCILSSGGGSVVTTLSARLNGGF